ncbi:hypothetical protein ACVFI8_01875 [Agarivorans sp. MS3-6]
MMSQPSTLIQCNRCDCSSDQHQINTWRVHLYNGLEIPLRKTIGWCNECNALVSADEFRDIDLIINEMAALVRQVASLEEKLKTNYWQRLLNRKLRRVRRRSVATLLTLGAELDISRQRHNHAECLNCGSHKISVIDPKLNIVAHYWQRESQAAISTGLLHPVCGGEFIATPIAPQPAPAMSKTSNKQPSKTIA